MTPYTKIPLRRLALILLVGILALMPLMSEAYAQAAPTGTPAEGTLMTTDGKGGTQDCRSIPEARGGTLLGVIVPCLSRTMLISTQNFSAEMISILNPIIFAYITLVVVLFGSKVLTGGTQHGGGNRLKGEAFLLVFKVGLVFGILQLVPGYLVPAAYDVMTQSQATIASSLAGSASGAGCVGSSLPAGGASPIWVQMDCVLGKLYGFTTGSGGRPNMLLMASAFGFLGGFLFGGTFGVALFLMCVGALWSLLMLVVRTASAFLHGYLYVCVMFILSPIFMPLTLLKQTQPYFQSWTKGILGSMLLPIIISSYSVIALKVYDKVLFEPGSEFQKLFDPAFAQKVQAAPREAFNWNPTGSPAWRASATGQKEAKLYSNPLMKNEIFPFLTGSNVFGAFSMPNVTITKEQFEKMFYTAVRVLFTTMIISEGLKIVMKASTRLTGSLAVGQTMSVAGPLETRLMGGIEGAKAGLNKALGGTSGTAFVGGMKNVPQEVVRGFISRM